MRSLEEFIEEEVARAPGFRREQAHGACRAVALAVIRYRAAHQLSQHDPASEARLEAVGRQPVWRAPGTTPLWRSLELSRKLGLRVRIDVGLDPGVMVQVARARSAD